MDKNKFNLLVSDIMKEYNLSKSEAKKYVEENYTNKDISKYKNDNDLIRLINKLNITNEDIKKPSVFWTDGMIYIEDEYEKQFTMNIDFFYAWKFAKIFCLDFDYDASDKQVLELGQTIVSEYYEDTFDDVNKEIIIDTFFDMIKKDFNEILLVDWNDIDWQQIKRHICQCIEEEPYACSYGGSATFIAKWLWETINEHIGDTDEYGHRKVIYADDDESTITNATFRSNKNAPKFRDNHPNKDILRELRDKYLQADEYDINGFTQALKEVNQCKMNVPKDFNEFLIQSSRISYKCYELLGHLIANNINYKQEFLVGYINWFGDYDRNERYIYCHIDSNKNEIYFQENRQAPKSAYLHDIAFPHLIFDSNRIQKDIEIKFTEQYIDDIMNDFELTDDNRVAYVHCHMYGTVGKYL